MEGEEFQGKNWIFTGVTFGLIMFILAGLVIPFLFKEDIELKHLPILFVVWLVGGFMYSYTMKFFYKWYNGRKQNKI